MSERPFFPVFFKNKDKLKYLNMEQRGELMTALFDYASEGEEPELEGVMGLCFSVFRDDIDSSLENYKRTCEANRKNIQKRWAKKNNEENEGNNTDVYDAIPAYSENTNKKIEEEAEVEVEAEDEERREVEKEEKRNIYSSSSIDLDSETTTKNNTNNDYKAIFDIFHSKFHKYPSKCMQKRIKNSTLSHEQTEYAIDKAYGQNPRNPEAYLTSLINKWEKEGIPSEAVSQPSQQSDELEDWEKRWQKMYLEQIASCGLSDCPPTTGDNFEEIQGSVGGEWA